MTSLDKARTCIERWRRRGYVEQVNTFEAILADNERLRAALEDIIVYSDDYGTAVKIARAALGGDNG